MTIRTATSDDIDGIRTVAKASWDTDYPDILSRESIEDGFDEWYSPDQIRNSLTWANTLLLIAEVDDRIVGFAHAVWEREETDRDDPGEKDGDILRLYVHPEYRGEGLGRKLFEATRDELADQGVTALSAMVLENNDLGNDFYSGFGFEQIDTREISIGEETYSENRYRLDLDEA